MVHRSTIDRNIPWAHNNRRSAILLETDSNQTNTSPSYSRCSLQDKYWQVTNTYDLTSLVDTYLHVNAL